MTQSSLSVFGPGKFTRPDIGGFTSEPLELSVKTPTFQIGGDRNVFLGKLSGHQFVFSYDQETWQKFDNNDGSAHSFRFYNDAPFHHDEIYVAYNVPYYFSRTISQMQAWSESPFVSRTPSGGDSFSVGTVLNTTEYVAADLDLFGFRISDDRSMASKKKVVLFGGNHSGEMGGNWALEGLVDFALSDSPNARRLRQFAELYVYPQIDPLGRIEGAYRGNSQNAFGDHNRYWDASVSGTNGGFAEIDVINAAVKHDTQSDVDYAFDFHGFFEPDPSYIYTDNAGVDSGFLQELLSLEPGIDVFRDNNTQPEGILEFWAKRPEGFNAELSFTPEFPPHWMPEDYRSMGASYGLALAKAVSGIRGDFNDDQVVDASDIDLLAANLDGHELSFDLNQDGAISSADMQSLLKEVLETTYGDVNLDGLVDQRDLQTVTANLYQHDTGWAKGDFNGDATTDGSDINLWLAHRIPNHSAVPEPSGFCIPLVVVGILSGLFRRNNQQSRTSPLRP